MSSDADVIGIDLGTTQTQVGVVDAGFPILLADGRGSRMTRSVGYYAKDGTAVVGEEAWRRRVLEGERTVGSIKIKRLMGRLVPRQQGPSTGAMPQTLRNRRRQRGRMTKAVIGVARGSVGLRAGVQAGISPEMGGARVVAGLERRRANLLVFGNFMNVKIWPCI